MSGRKLHARMLRQLLCWVLFLALQTALFRSAGRLQWMAGGVSLRFAAPLAARQTEKALEYAGKAGSGYAFTFWTEQPDSLIEANGRTANARLLLVCGDAARLTPQELLWGAPPAAPGGCAVSDALAWRLWGALDVAGMELTIENTRGNARYTVRGVFREDAPCLLVQTAPDSAAFENVEVYAMESGIREAALENAALGAAVYGDTAPGAAASGNAVLENTASQNAAPGTAASGNTAPSVDAARSFARSGGLGVPAHAVNGSTLAALARLLCWLPPALCAVSLLWRFAWALSARARRAFWGMGLLLFALCLPRLLAALPAAWLPTRWSDFAFWQSLLQSGAARIEAWFALPPQSVDVAAKWLLFRHGALCLGGCIAGRRAVSLNLPPARPQAARSSGIPSARFRNTI